MRYTGNDFGKHKNVVKIDSRFFVMIGNNPNRETANIVYKINYYNNIILNIINFPHISSLHLIPACLSFGVYPL
jgi:hypothetical protein